MASPADRLFNGTPSSPRSGSSPTPVCTVHTCRRCRASIDSAEPCSFVAAAWRVCLSCAGQEQVLKHVPASRPIWGAALARTRRF
jgi:hypothetical protein